MSLYKSKSFQRWLKSIGHPDSRGRRSRLGVQIANVFNNCSLNTKSEVRKAFESGRLKPGKTYNYGWQGHREVAKWLGLPEPVKPSVHTRYQQCKRYERALITLRKEAQKEDSTPGKCFFEIADEICSKALGLKPYWGEKGTRNDSLF